MHNIPKTSDPTDQQVSSVGELAGLCAPLTLLPAVSCLKVLRAIHGLRASQADALVDALQRHKSQWLEELVLLALVAPGGAELAARLIPSTIKRSAELGWTSPTPEGFAAALVAADYSAYSPSNHHR